MVTRNPAPTKGAKKPKLAPKAQPEPRSRISDLDVDERRAFEEWKRAKIQDQGAWEHKTDEEMELGFLKKLNKKNKKSGKQEKSGGCADDDPCGAPKPQIDLEMLAERVFQRLIFEARIERERVGWAG